MKKLFAILISFIIALSVCCVPSFAYHNATLAYKHENEDETFLMISFDSDYVEFSDTMRITIVKKLNNDYYTKDYYKDDVICTKEVIRSYFISSNNFGSSKNLVVYIPCVPVKDFYVLIQASSVLDADGNGNPEQEKLYPKDVPLRFNHSNENFQFRVGDDLTAMTVCPADFYFDDCLISENNYDSFISSDTAGEHKVVVRKYDTVIAEYSYSSTEVSASEKINAAGNNISDHKGDFLSGFAVLLTPILAIFPPLGLASAASPFIAIGQFFGTIVESFGILFS